MKSTTAVQYTITAPPLHHPIEASRLSACFLSPPTRPSVSYHPQPVSESPDLGLVTVDPQQLTGHNHHHFVPTSLATCIIVAPPCCVLPASQDRSSNASLYSSLAHRYATEPSPSTVRSNSLFVLYHPNPIASRSKCCTSCIDLSTILSILEPFHIIPHKAVDAPTSTRYFPARQ